MKDNICQTQFSAKEQLNNFPSNSAPAESIGQPLDIPLQWLQVFLHSFFKASAKDGSLQRPLAAQRRQFAD